MLDRLPFCEDPVNNLDGPILNILSPIRRSRFQVSVSKSSDFDGRSPATRAS
jgi:hypothetical protein